MGLFDDISRESIAADAREETQRREAESAILHARLSTEWKALESLALDALAALQRERVPPTMCERPIEPTGERFLGYDLSEFWIDTEGGIVSWRSVSPKAPGGKFGSMWARRSLGDGSFLGQWTLGGTSVGERTEVNKWDGIDRFSLVEEVASAIRRLIGAAASSPVELGTRKSSATS